MSNCITPITPPEPIWVFNNLNKNVAPKQRNKLTCERQYQRITLNSGDHISGQAQLQNLSQMDSDPIRPQPLESSAACTSQSVDVTLLPLHPSADWLKVQERLSQTRVALEERQLLILNLQQQVDMYQHI